VPVVPPRDPAPLFSWEVYPHLYPPARPPRVPGPGIARLLVALLLMGTVVLAGLAAGIGWAGAQSLHPGGFTVRGAVYDPGSAGPQPAIGAIVKLTSETGRLATASTGPNGTFSFAAVPPGGIALNISQLGYGSLVVELFASSVYSSLGISGVLSVTLPTGNASVTTYESETPFGDLNSFLTDLWSSSVLLGMGAIVAGVGAYAAFRQRRFPYAVAGAGAAIAGPIAPELLGVTIVFPVVTWFAALAVAAGAAAFAIAVMEVFNRGDTSAP
jgi:hypothetical protein